MSALRGRRILVIILLVLLAILVVWAVSQCAYHGEQHRGTGVPLPSKHLEKQDLEETESAAKHRPTGGKENDPSTKIPSSTSDQSQVDWNTLEIPSDEPHANCEVFHHTAYTVSYSRIEQQPRWVAYRLDRGELIKHTTRKSHTFRLNPSLRVATVSKVDYKGSGYDLGHLAPAGDMTFSDQAMRESFYFTNVSPQLPNFNRGIWNQIETYTRHLAQRYDSVYIVTGPSFYSGKIDEIGNPPIPVASHFYKAFLIRDSQGWHAAALMVPHCNGLKRFDEFWISIDSLERMTGFDLFHQLPDEIERMVEQYVEREYW